MLCDDAYGTAAPMPFLGRQLYVPELSVGRLVETPVDIAAQLDRFTAAPTPGRLIDDGADDRIRLPQRRCRPGGRASALSHQAWRTVAEHERLDAVDS